MVTSSAVHQMHNGTRQRGIGRPAAMILVDSDHLRDWVRNSLLVLPESERNRARDRLLSGLRSGGLYIEEALLMLGIPAETPDDLSPSDLAMLVRYAHINSPATIARVRHDLAVLFARAKEEAAAEPSRAA